MDLEQRSPHSKSLGTDGELEVLVYPLERYRNARNFEMVESTVEVAYVLHTEADCRLLVGCHFDFQCAQGEPLAGHPLFHVHVTGSLNNLDPRLAARGIDDAGKPAFPAMRLPTAHMSFASTLINIAADNFEAQSFDLFIKEIRAHGDFPFMSNTRFNARMDGVDWKMRCCAWYPDPTAITTAPARNNPTVPRRRTRR